ncbi:sodium:calcium antiporter [Anaerobacillus alkaliphilus]|uniref:Sodium:calcium antiporter n=1 Tax=Anaerobacillus alkaliphilus TaxID=1548597 RepID=A0A4Q0VWD4_9BACI|nr:sodium:calcium antiporter [Anaerobacillus alkaliphilus]RXJ04027.1 sodium:calcium antiporter [Anaerobacillus alkaliphilus]
MVFIIFLLVAAITVFAATKLSTYADVISAKTAVGGMLIGSMLLAGATSLPEITTSYTAVMLNNPDLAVGSLLGSNLFNLVILAFLDLYFRKDQVFERVWTQHRYTIGIGITLMFLILFSLRLDVMFIVLGIGLDTFVILGGYIIGMIIMSRLKQTSKTDDTEPEREEPLPELTARTAMIRFGVTALIILITGSILTIAGDRIAVITGLGASFVGSFLIAASTSLPEAVACFVACKLRNFNLAIGSILGSNLFNILILCGTDIFYRQGPLLVHVEPVHELTTSLVICLYFITFYLLVRVKPKTSFNYSIPSLLIIFSYFITSYYIFIYS